MCHQQLKHIHKQKRKNEKARPNPKKQTGNLLAILKFLLFVREWTFEERENVYARFFLSVSYLRYVHTCALFISKIVRDRFYVIDLTSTIEKFTCWYLGGVKEGVVLRITTIVSGFESEPSHQVTAIKINFQPSDDQITWDKCL